MVHKGMTLGCGADVRSIGRAELGSPSSERAQSFESFAGLCLAIVSPSFVRCGTSKWIPLRPPT
ncbi:hypothetical protein GGTG_04634 [Gaeumannomyces tritici R3-111a-1]|uniref:Uncharacterized protein n=1 Tax=Gaeumannomyces tritici (strain R3-111a-1) TaxID=644352 RepID=J3NTN4_GAET3|nr:hypothetical protein GGTG_04634 [Gaeumannomyces tritici R3-111a-1]EJT79549.1 hypothetical protein GGTG_04634 [Gaeumannomyces tritici R3-111a-1]